MKKTEYHEQNLYSYLLNYYKGDKKQADETFEKMTGCKDYKIIKQFCYF